MSEYFHLAASGSPSLLLTLAGVVVVAVLLSAFWYGGRRARAGKDPGPLAGQPPQAQQHKDAWQTPEKGPNPGDRP
ncbi:DUF6479 family protein [Streptomyces xanthophaeus]